MSALLISWTQIARTRRRTCIERDMIEEITRLRKEAVFPSIRNIDPEEAPRFKVVSTTPRRRRFLLWDSPRAMMILSGRGSEG